MRKAALLSLLLIPAILQAQTVRLSHIVTIEGLQDNPIIGYGIVVGLNGTGDSADNSETREFLGRMMDNFGMTGTPANWEPKNTAVVVVMANVLPGAAVGSRVDVTVSSIFDAKSIEGGRLIVAPLYGGDNTLYAVAQGAVVIDGTSKTGGVIPMGGIVQREIEHPITTGTNTLTINVNERLGIAVMGRVLDAIRAAYPAAVQRVQNYKITLKIPDGMDVYQFVSELFDITVDIDQEPSVLIDSRSGIIVAGGDVIVTEAAVTLNGTEVRIGGTQNLWGGTQQQTGQGAARVLPNTATVSELADALNRIGATKDDIVKILQMLYDNGNLKAKLIVR